MIIEFVEQEAHLLEGYGQLSDNSYGMPRHTPTWLAIICLHLAEASVTQIDLQFEA